MSDTFDIGPAKPNILLEESKKGIEVQILLSNGARFLICQIRDDGTLDITKNSRDAIELHHLDNYLQLEVDGSIKINELIAVTGQPPQ